MAEDLTGGISSLQLEAQSRDLEEGEPAARRPENEPLSQLEAGGCRSSLIDKPTDDVQYDQDFHADMLEEDVQHEDQPVPPNLNSNDNCTDDIAANRTSDVERIYQESTENTIPKSAAAASSTAQESRSLPAFQRPTMRAEPVSSRGMSLQTLQTSASVIVVPAAPERSPPPTRQISNAETIGNVQDTGHIDNHAVPFPEQMNNASDVNRKFASYFVNFGDFIRFGCSHRGLSMSEVEIFDIPNTEKSTSSSRICYLLRKWQMTTGTRAQEYDTKLRERFTSFITYEKNSPFPLGTIPKRLVDGFLDVTLPSFVSLNDFDVFATNARGLELSYETIRDIRLNNPSDVIAYQIEVLLTWKRSNFADATSRKICELTRSYLKFQRQKSLNG